MLTAPHEIGIVVGTVIVVVVTGIVSFITGTKKSKSGNTEQPIMTATPVTVEYLIEREEKYYKEFVAKEHYAEDKHDRDTKFSEFQEELKEIKKSQTEVNEKVNQINISVQLTAKDIEYIKRAVDGIPRRQNDC